MIEQSTLLQKELPPDPATPEGEEQQRHTPVYQVREQDNHRATYQDGVLHGPAEFYKKDGTFLRTHFQTGQLHGETTFHNENGTVRTQLQFNQGQKEGPFIAYDAFGRIKQVLHYHLNRLEGQMIVYYPSGAILASGSYVQGKRHGEFITYDEKGAARKILIFDQGHLVERRR